MNESESLHRCYVLFELETFKMDLTSTVPSRLALLHPWEWLSKKHVNSQGQVLIFQGKMNDVYVYL